MLSISNLYFAATVKQCDDHIEYPNETNVHDIDDVNNDDYIDGRNNKDDSGKGTEAETGCETQRQESG